jgi:hypothetical protein
MDPMRRSREALPAGVPSLEGSDLPERDYKELRITEEELKGLHEARIRRSISARVERWPVVEDLSSNRLHRRRCYRTRRQESAQAVWATSHYLLKADDCNQ